ncbi:MAG: ATP-binding cassette domain-containing protein [Firmicutes bacterium]|nr:ATP-binding cassette domain-containing protein [Bacillota bacterium]
MSVIQVENLTKDYGDRRGVFGVSFEINQGEVFGFLGPNGAGKTTTIRHILGFIKPDSGKTYVNGIETWGNAHNTNRDIGYIPGEIAFPEKMTGMDIIKWLGELSGAKNLDKAKEVLDLLQLKNAAANVKRMSKGMKQKIGIACAFLHDPKILILDEPSSGLDPLMQDTFTELLRRQKAEGKTILLSSHIFSEVEKTCDRVAIIKQGEIVTSFHMDEIKRPKFKTFKVKFSKDGESRRIANEKLNFAEINHEKNRVRITVLDAQIKGLLKTLSAYEIEYLSETKLTLEQHFMKFYSTQSSGGAV